MTPAALAQVAADMAATAVHDAAARTFAICCALGANATDANVNAVKKTLRGYADDLRASGEVTT